MAEFQAGEVVVPVVPDVGDFIKRLKKDLVGPITDLGREIGEDLAKGIRDGLGKSDPFGPLKDEQEKQRRKAPKDGDKQGGAFAQAFKKRLESALKNLPKAELDADASEAQKKVAELRAQMAALAQKTIGVDIDAAAAEAELAGIVTALQALDGEDVTVDVRADVDAALAALGILRQETDKTDERLQQVGGKFARDFQAKVASAVKALPLIELKADSSAADREIAALRARMDALSSRTIGIDIDAAAAEAELAAIVSDLRAIGGEGVTVDVGADVAAALAALGQVEAETSRINGRTANVRVNADVAGALGQIALVGAALAALPAAASVAVGLGAIGAAAGAAGVGIAGLAAIAAPSISRITEANKAAEKAQEAAATATAKVSTAAEDAAIAQYQQQIRTLQAVGAADQLRDAQDRVKDAISGVATAQQRLQSTVRSAAEAQAAAAERVARAERSLIDAQRSALKAQESLNDARREAARDLEDLGSRLQGSQLDLRDATLDVSDAEDALAAARKKGDPEDIERAEIAYERAKLRVTDLQTSIERLKEEQTEADAKGVEGSDRVVAAKEGVEAANQRVLDQQAALNKAHTDEAKAAEDAAQRIKDAKKGVKDAEERVVDAKAAVEAAKRARKIAELQEKIRKAQEKKAAKQVAASSAGGAAKKDPMADLSPAAKVAAKEFKKFSDAYLAWQKKLEPAILPAVTGGLKIIKALFKPLTPIITGSAKALVGLEKAVAKALGGPFWRSFFKDLAVAAPKAITGFGKALGNIITGVAGIVKAFFPFQDTVIGGLEDATAAFAEWGKNLGQSEGFKAFVDYITTNAPKVVEVIQNIWTVLKNLFSGVAVDGPGLLDLIVKVTDWVATLDPATLQTFALAALAVVAAFKTWQVIQGVVGGVKKSIETAKTIASGAKSVWSGISKAASGAARVAAASARGIATAAKVAAGATVKGASAAWNGIRTAASKAGSAAKVAASAIVNAGKTAAIAALNLGKVALGYGKIAAQAAIARTRMVLVAAAQGIIKVATLAWAAAQRILNLALASNPIGLIVVAIGLLVAGLIYAWNNSETFRDIVLGAWDAIKTGISWIWENVLKPIWDGMVWLWQNVLAPAAIWLWEKVLKPAWDGISSVIKWAWENVIKPALAAFEWFFKNVIGPVVNWLWLNIIKPVWGYIGTAVKVAWERVILPALKALWAYITETLAPKVLWLYQTIIKPTWDKVGSVIKTVWENVLKPTFDFLHKMIFETIPNGFKKGVGFIETAWNKVKEVAKKPIEFIVDTVWNKGIVKVWNYAAKLLGLEPLNEVHFAKGGIYPGYSPGRDIGMAAVSGGEAIMRPEWTRAVGEDYIHSANAAARRGGVGGVAKYLGVAGDPGGTPFIGAFAGGGIIDSALSILGSGLRSGAESLLNPLLDSAQASLGNSPWAKLAVGIPRKIVGSMLNFLDTKETPGMKAVAFARQQLGEPYLWGGTGPDAWDCSGLVQAAARAGGASIPRVTQDQIKALKHVQTPKPGDLGFPHEGHVWMYSNPVSKIIEAPYTGGHVQEVAARQAQVVAQWYDNGGYLMPGTSLVHNGTGQPERVLTDQQWDQVAQGARGRDGGGDLNIENFQATERATPRQIVEALSWQRKARRGG